MHRDFLPYIEQAQYKVDKLLAMSPVTCLTLPKNMPRAGIYVFSERGQHLYVGRSNDIKARLARHSRPSATHRMAAFAFRLARESTGRIEASYKSGPLSRKGLVLDPAFMRAFENAKCRIRKMHVRFVEEVEPTKQALLEIYTAVVLRTPYNDFDTH